MKTHSLLILLAVFFLFNFQAKAQQNKDQGQLGLPGDNLNLYAVLKIFQESETLEIFEKKLNEEDSKINNLDLDGDNEIDYIKVVDNVDDGIHTIVLQVEINKNEIQDVASFVVQKDKNGKVQIQVIGDEDLYGKDYIIEPNYSDDEKIAETSTPNPGYTGNTTVVIHNTTTYEVAQWPVVRYIFLPSYSIWHSPWHYGYYPSYWRPWRPLYWHNYYGYHYHWNYYYNGYYRRSNYYRYPAWRTSYYSTRRVRSPYVYNRVQRGDYRTTYSRPDQTRIGSESFRRRYPNAPSANDRAPVVRPGRPGGNNSSVTNPGGRPGTRPETTNPNRPSTRPGNTVSPRPKPPVTTRPSSSDNRRPSVNRPSTRPSSSTRPSPGNNRPAEKKQKAGRRS